MRSETRTYLTPVEARIRDLERVYLQECQTRPFRVRFPGMAQRPYVMRWHPMSTEDEFDVNKIDFLRCYEWIALRTGYDYREVAAILRQVEEVYRHWLIDLRQDSDPLVLMAD